MAVSVAKRRSRSRRRCWVMACPVVGLLAGDVQVAGDVAVPGGPDQERADAFALVGAVAGVVGVDVGLGEGGWPDAEGGGPGQEGLGLDEPAAGVLAGGGAQRPGGGPGAHRRELVPQPELAQQPQVRVPGQGLQAAVQPRAELAQLLVGSGQDTAADQQIPQVGHRPRAGPGVQRLVGQGQLAGGQGHQQVADVRLVQPFQHGGRAGRGGQGPGQRLQRRRDGAGPVIEQPGGRPGHRARAAEPAGAPPPAGHAGFGAAPQAAELAGDAGAVPADRHPVAQAGQQPGRRCRSRGRSRPPPAPRSGTASTGAPRGTKRPGTRGARTGRTSASSQAGS